MCLVVIVAGCAPRRQTRPAPHGPSAGQAGAAAARYRVSIETPRRARLRLEAYAVRPDRLRIEVSSPLGQRLLSVVCRSPRCLVLSPRDRCYAWADADLAGWGLPGLAGTAPFWIAALTSDRDAVRAFLGEPVSSGEEVVFSRALEEGARLTVRFKADSQGPPHVIETRSPPDVSAMLDLAGRIESMNLQGAFEQEIPEGFQEVSAPLALDPGTAE
jgi:hypothetical protein